MDSRDKAAWVLACAVSSAVVLSGKLAAWSKSRRSRALPRQGPGPGGQGQQEEELAELVAVALRTRAHDLDTAAALLDSATRSTRLPKKSLSSMLFAAAAIVDSRPGLPPWIEKLRRDVQQAHSPPPAWPLSASWIEAFIKAYRVVAKCNPAARAALAALRRERVVRTVSLDELMDKGYDPEARADLEDTDDGVSGAFLQSEGTEAPFDEHAVTLRKHVEAVLFPEIAYNSLARRVCLPLRSVAGLVGIAASDPDFLLTRRWCDEDC